LADGSGGRHGHGVMCDDDAMRAIKGTPNHQIKVIGFGAKRGEAQTMR